MIYRFDPFTLDAERLELRRGDELCAVEPQVFSLLVYLIENRERVVGKDELIDAVWDGRIVSDATLSTRMNAARRAIGDSGKAQARIRTMPRRGFRFVAEIVEDAQSSEGRFGAHLATQSIRFCTAEDGVRIAYATVGQGPPLVKAANWLSHLEFDWKSPVWRHLFEEFSKDRQLVRYDERANGLSDWDAEDISFEALVRDLETVVDAVGLDRFPLLGISQGCAVSIAYAVRHPERVTRLVLYGGYARGRDKRGGPADVEEAIFTLMREGWGQENPAFRQIFTSLFMPDATTEQMQWMNDLQKMTASPENAIRLRQATNEIEVTDLLGKIGIPTLVLHARDDALVPFEEGRRMAAEIPDARFVALEGRNHLLIEDEPAWQIFVDEVRRFLDNSG